ncbi:hypothetical protein [Paraburkholderia kururiensis]|uniref:Lipoprotein n=1 Tax=Paraburkholderia kururiensis TaxID=984307 RepID=A0ABZ0WFE7_9BURK|nr:hypothetical protein [Paraburkholderia kururiensis]WQD76073.1 hypothetical protein U0042_18360 [Paraburkholderia kururiensis]
MKLTTSAIAIAASVVVFAVMPCYAAGKIEVARYEKQVERAAVKECDGDTGDGVGTTAYPGNLAGTGPVTIISAGANGCAGGQAPRTWLWVFFADGGASQVIPSPNFIESIGFDGDRILVKSLEVGQEDPPNFPSHLTQLVYKLTGRKPTLVSSRLLAIKKD